MKIFFYSSSKSKQIGPLHIESRKTKPNFPSVSMAHGLSLKSINKRRI